MPDAFSLDNNTYYPAKNIVVAPSSNGVDSGKIYTEYNGRKLTLNILDRNYVIAPNPGGYDVSKKGSGVHIESGSAMLNGFAVYTKEGIDYRLPTKDEIVTDPECYYKDYALLCLHTIFDAQHNLNGNEMVNGTWYCTGITVEYVSYEDYSAHPEEYLLLGGIDEDGNIKPNDDKFTRLDAKYIYVYIEGDPETGAPPEQSTDLYTFINNFLHGYWVSKVGDNEYGELLFKTAPEHYFEEDFDYTKEDPLTSTRYGVKISKHGTTIIIKPETEAAANYVTQFLPAYLGFYQGTCKGDNNKAFDVDVFYQNFAELGKVLTSRSNADSSAGAVREVVESTSGNPAIVVEHNTKAHNGVDAGDVVYSTEDSEKIGYGADTTTKYGPTINYLKDKDNNIRTQNTSDTSKYAKMDSIYALIEVSSDTGEPTVHVISKTGTPIVKFDRTGLTGKIQLANTNNAKETNNLAWKNVLELCDNLKLVGTDGGSLYVTGFVYLGDAENPATQEVPDYANSGGMRKLKPFDVYSKGQIWSAVYNDVAEMFAFDTKSEWDVTKTPMKIMAVSKDNPGTYTVADKYNNQVIGIVSENPAFCCGGDDNCIAVPVALAGRVRVYYEGKKPKIGDYVGLSKKIPGYSTKCRKHNKNCCGRIVQIINDDIVVVLVR